jgi:hypothetical protein
LHSVFYSNNNCAGELPIRLRAQRVGEVELERRKAAFVPSE